MLRRGFIASLLSCLVWPAALKRRDTPEALATAISDEKMRAIMRETAAKLLGKLPEGWEVVEAEYITSSEAIHVLAKIMRVDHGPRERN